MAPLFRPEAVAERAQSHWGSIIFTQAPALRWVSIGLLLACAVGAALVLSLDYARKVRVAGYLEPSGGIAEVTAPMAGQVVTLHVREGSTVRRGEPLLSLDLGRLDEQGVPINALEANHLRASMQRLDELAAAELSRHQTELHSVQRELSHLDAEHMALRDELTVVDERQALLHRQEGRLAGLSKNGLVARSAFDRQRRETLAVRQAASQLRRTLADNRAQADLRRAALVRLADEFRVQRLRMGQERAGLERRLEQALGDHRTTVVAPRDGVAAFLQFAVGDRVIADQVLMTVAPDAQTFDLVLLAGAGAAGRITVGNDVRFRVLGASRDSDTSGAGVVREISRTPQKSYRLVSWIPVEGPVFRARAEVTAYPGKLRLRHGVQVEAFVVTASNSLWRWLVEPLSSALAVL